MIYDLEDNLFLEAYTVANFYEPHLFFTDNRTFSSTNSYTKLTTSVGIPYAYYSEGTTIKIRQNYGSSFGYCGFMRFPYSHESIINFGVYNEMGGKIAENVQNYINNQSEDYFFLVDIIYNSGSNAYTITLNIYSTLQNKWIYTNNLNMYMPSGYNTGSISDYCPGFIFETTDPVWIYNFRGYNHNIGIYNAEDLAKGKVYYLKSNNTLMTSHFNEFKSTDYANGGHNYTNTCFSKKGGVCAKSEIVEPGNYNCIDRDGIIAFDNLIEF